MSAFLYDVRHSLRGLLRSPGFFAMAVITLALGIGANTAIFSMVNGILFRPLPVRDADRLVVISTKFENIPYFMEASYMNYKDILDRSETLEDAVAWEPGIPGMATETFAVKTTGIAVTSNFFTFFGIQPSAGRFFEEHDDDAQGARPEIVLGHSFWQSRFGADAGVLGSTIRLNDNPFTIVGVMPEGFSGTEFPFVPEFYAPMSMLERIGAGYRASRTNTNFRVMGRLKPGVTADQAQAEIDLLAAGLIEEHPDQLDGMTLHVIPELKARPEPAIHQIMPVIAMLFLGMVSLVLLIACANIANLVLARGLGRRREMSVRAALGATRGRLARQLITESLLVASMGGALGLGSAAWASGWLEAMRPPTDLPMVFDYSMDVRVFAFAAVATVLTGLLFGLLPALQASRPDLHGAMKEGGRGSSEGRGGRRVRSALVVSEFAVAAVLLVVAGLFVRSLDNAKEIDLGFEPEQTLLATVSPDAAGYDQEESARLLERLLERARELPGVTHAAAAATVPFGYNYDGMELYPEGRTPAPDERMDGSLMTDVTTGYFQTVRTPVLRGRVFTDDDDANAPKVAIVNEKLAEMFWPGEDPLGKRMMTGQEGETYEVVGLVPTGKYQMLAEDDMPFLFVPWKQRRSAEMIFYLRTAGPPANLAGAFRDLVRDADASVPVSSVYAFDHFVYEGKGLMPFRMGAALMAAFAVLGLALAAVGVFGALSYFVSSRTNEIGVRMALGADRASVMRMVLGSGAKLAAIGVAFGLAGAAASAHLVAPLLLDVSPTDPLTYAVVAAFLAAVTVTACYLPARRAMRQDPVTALRQE